MGSGRSLCYLSQGNLSGRSMLRPYRSASLFPFRPWRSTPRKCEKPLTISVRGFFCVVDLEGSDKNGFLFQCLECSQAQPLGIAR